MYFTWWYLIVRQPYGPADISKSDLEEKGTFSRIRVLQASFLLGRLSRVPATGTPVAGTGTLLLINGWRCCLGPPIYSSSLSYSGGWFAALTNRASKKTRAYKKYKWSERGSQENVRWYTGSHLSIVYHITESIMLLQFSKLLHYYGPVCVQIHNIYIQKTLQYRFITSVFKLYKTLRK